MIVHPAVSAEVRNDNLMAADSSPEGSFLERVEKICRASTAPEVQVEQGPGAEPLPALCWSVAVPAQPQLHCPAPGWYRFSHADSEMLLLPWLLIFCQVRDLRWPSKGLDKCQSQHEAGRAEGVVEITFLGISAEAESCSIDPIINGLFSMKCLV